ncbi:hypothetical protein DAPPUDRAFT_309209 [Daphnia pulex]|uniref:Uncharacterized protein n=1 Tax=Daphnia pulex TaxID=6669 RepID=E9HAR6_DAPPU|nr:hypothetical protein DAPPUDRAFT_309209 [Daphnia pulex]|eukprot:EFX71074.1 hypothetical protein DAPPUDRAFT_309209 [Daphnia pulex]
MGSASLFASRRWSSPALKGHLNLLPRLVIEARKTFRPTARFFQNVAVHVPERASKDENGQSTFMKKSFLQEYPQKKLDCLIAELKLNTHYWGPYTSTLDRNQQSRKINPCSLCREKEMRECFTSAQ